MAIRGYKDAKGRQRYEVDFLQRGNRVHRRAPPNITHAQAREWETQLRRELFDTGPLQHKPDVLLSEAIQSWLDTNPHPNHRRNLLNKAEQLAPFVRGKFLSQAPEVAAMAISVWASSKPANTSAMRGLKGQPSCALSAATINKRLCILKAAAKYAWHQNKISENLSGKIRLLPTNNARQVYLTRAQVLTLAKSTSAEVGAAIIISAYTGLRASELLALTSTHSRGGTLTVARSKTGKPRVVPVPGPALPYLSALPLGLSYQQLRDEFLQARAAAGLEHVHWHDLRHTCASWLINAGVDLYTVGKILGHSSQVATARYSHLSTETLQKAMRKLR